MYKLVGCFNLHLIVLARLYGIVLYIQADGLFHFTFNCTGPVIWKSTVHTSW